MNKNTEIAAKTAFDIAPLMEGGAEIAKILLEDMTALGPVELSRVKMPSGQTPMFTVMRGKDDDDPEMVKTIDAIIIRQHPAYAYWSDPNSLNGSRPDCFSFDGVVGQLSPELGGECLSCNDCPHNQYGTEVRQDGQPGKGKACKNGHRLYLLRSGDYLPIMLTVPPTGLRAYKQYLQSLIIPRAKNTASLRYWQVITTIALKQAKSDAATYYTPTFAVKDFLCTDTARAVKAYADAFARSAGDIAVTASDAEQVF